MEITRKGQRRHLSVHAHARSRPLERVDMNLSNESLAVFLLCSHLGLSDEPEAKPLSNREWNQLQQKLTATSFDRAKLPGLPAGEIASRLQVSDEEATRYAGLLGRGSVINDELERLTELGI